MVGIGKYVFSRTFTGTKNYSLVKIENHRHIIFRSKLNVREGRSTRRLEDGLSLYVCFNRHFDCILKMLCKVM